jgi:peptidoglycan hydrolase-like protein with peptidoglycan-binding domain
VRQPVVYVPQVPSQDRYREIQQALAEKGFFKGEPDGHWNAESVAALREFQKAQNLDADGKLGSLSLIALGLGPKRIVAAQNTPPPVPQPQP